PSATAGSCSPSTTWTTPWSVSSSTAPNWSGTSWSTRISTGSASSADRTGSSSVSPSRSPEEARQRSWHGAPPTPASAALRLRYLPPTSGWGTDPAPRNCSGGQNSGCGTFPQPPVGGLIRPLAIAQGDKTPAAVPSPNLRLGDSSVIPAGRDACPAGRGTGA